MDTNKTKKEKEKERKKEQNTTTKTCSLDGFKNVVEPSVKKGKVLDG